MGVKKKKAEDLTEAEDHHAVARPFALSGMDGRYRKQTARLAALLCEESLTVHRLYIEVCWLLHLGQNSGQTGLSDFTPLAEAESSLKKERDRLLKLIKTSSSEPSTKQQSDEQKQAIEEVQDIFSKVKEQEQGLRHDVKATEYWLRERLEELELKQLRPFAHFACTSEDINSTSWAMMLQAALSDIVLPAAQQLREHLTELAEQHAALPMLARTHGQAATPTTFGKEAAVFAHRLRAQLQQLEQLQPSAKFSGATGNFSAHSFALPDADWRTICSDFVVNSLKLDFNVCTTQIEPGDRLAEICHCLMRTGRILTDLSRDFWGYIALNYLQQQRTTGAMGSSTMPHKINPIDFENAEGNLSMAHVLLERLAADLTVSRWQRDLSGSTQIRNLGQALGHFQVAAASLQRGLQRVTPNEQAMKADLDGNAQALQALQTLQAKNEQDMQALQANPAGNEKAIQAMQDNLDNNEQSMKAIAGNWQVLTEAVQTLLRLAGIPNACELIMLLTGQKKMTQESYVGLLDALHQLPDALHQLSDEQKARLLKLLPENEMTDDSFATLIEARDGLTKARKSGLLDRLLNRLRELTPATFLGLAKHLAGPSWEFYKGDAGKWRWIRTPIIGETVEESKEGYKNLADCHADAVRNGYGGPKPNKRSSDKSA